MEKGEHPSAATAGPDDDSSAASTEKTFELPSTPSDDIICEMRRECSRVNEVALYKRTKPDAEPTTNTL
jgi:hypothetical protein